MANNCKMWQGRYAFGDHDPATGMPLFLFELGGKLYPFIDEEGTNAAKAAMNEKDWRVFWGMMNGIAAGVPFADYWPDKMEGFVVVWEGKV